MPISSGVFGFLRPRRPLNSSEDSMVTHGHDGKISSNGNAMDMKHAARAQNRANHVQKKKGWLSGSAENEEAAQSSSPPSSSTEKASLHADKKSTLGMHLTQLQTEDPKCVFIARRINGMGFQSKDVLSAHYEQYGRVLKVLVAHSKVKPFRRQGAQSRIRPGSLGFIVMDSPQSVEKILAHGANQTVAGHNISVERFEKIAKPQETGQSTATWSPGTGRKKEAFEEGVLPGNLVSEEL
eukprot:Skav202011  [mRNA]  locus=scaffold1829:159235:169915:- [translate_table: standard]